MLPALDIELPLYGMSGMLLYQVVIERSRDVDPSSLRYMLPMRPM